MKPGYIPDHIRNCRTDRLVHIQDSLRLVMQRFLPDYWSNSANADIVQRVHYDLALIGAELYARRGRRPRDLRAQWEPRYEKSYR